MHVVTPYYNLNAEQKKGIISANQKLYKKPPKKKRHLYSTIYKLSEEPGYIEVDLVEHNGGNSKGEFIYTLCGVDVKTYWVFLRPLKNKARVWTIEALDDIINSSLLLFTIFIVTMGVNLSIFICLSIAGREG